MIKIHISNSLIVKNCPEDILEQARKILTIENPAYHRVVRITGNSWAAQRDFKYYKERKGVIGTMKMPRGFAQRFISYLDKIKEPYEIEKDLIDIDFTHIWKPITLRDYQKPLVANALKHEAGVISAGTGSGKTVLAAEMTRILGKTTTILCPTTIIMRQFIDEFKKWFNYDVGQVGDGKKEIKPITVAMWQSLSADQELAERLSAQTSVLFADEVHTAISDERRKILEMFKPTYIYGLSGSPRRSKDDGRTNAIFFYFGEVVARYEMTQIIPTVEVIRTGIEIPVDNYAVMIDDLVENNNRNTLIAGLACGEVLEGKKVLILTKRREHCQKILEKLGSFNIYYADSDDKGRNDTLMAMRSGEKDFSILLGTYSLLAAGLDIPMLDVIIFAGDLKSDVLCEQGAGRVLRFFEGKYSAKIYDLFDNKNPILTRQFYERKRFYEIKKWMVNFG